MEKGQNPTPTTNQYVWGLRYVLTVAVCAMFGPVSLVHAQTAATAPAPAPIASKMDGAKPALGQSVTVTAPWVRATVPGQKGTGGFMALRSPVELQLVGASSAAAAVVEVHEMRMDGDVMRMRAIPALMLPAGKTVALAPGGYHLMLQDLHAPLQAGSSVTVLLQFQNAKGARFEQEVTMPVALNAPHQSVDEGLRKSEAAHQHHH